MTSSRFVETSHEKSANYITIDDHMRSKSQALRFAKIETL